MIKFPRGGGVTIHFRTKRGAIGALLLLVGVVALTVWGLM